MTRPRCGRVANAPSMRPARSTGMANEQPNICAYPWQQMIIDLTGEVVPCCFWSGYGNSGKPLGNTNVNTLDEIWNGPEYRRLRLQIVNNNTEGFPCHECLAYKW